MGEICWPVSRSPGGVQEMLKTVLQCHRHFGFARIFSSVLQKLLCLTTYECGPPEKYCAGVTRTWKCTPASLSHVKHFDPGTPPPPSTEPPYIRDANGAPDIRAGA